MSSVRTIGRYEIVRHLATGGMGRVYLARTSGLAGFERHVVVKTLDAKGDADFLTMFLDEARVLARLHHQHIAAIFEIVRTDDGGHFLVMDYVHGHNALAVWDRALDQNASLPLDFALTVVAAAASALHYAHTRVDKNGVPLDIVHRDVSLANLMVGFDGSIKLIDFGIAKATDRSSATQTGYVKGKLGYMAPEQVNGGVADRRTDIFALGLVLYELTTMARPFRAPNELELLLKIRNADIKLPSEIVKSFPRGLELIIMKALRPKPDDRFQDVDTMRREIEAFAHRNKLVMGDSAVAEVMSQLFDNVEPWVAAPEASATAVPAEISANTTMQVEDPPPTIVRQLRAATELADQMVIEVHSAPVGIADDKPTERHQSNAGIAIIPADVVPEDVVDNDSGVVTVLVAGGAAPPPIPKRRTEPRPTVPEPVKRRTQPGLGRSAPPGGGFDDASTRYAARPSSDGAVVVKPPPGARAMSEGVELVPPNAVPVPNWPAESGVVVAPPLRKPMSTAMRGALLSVATIAGAAGIALAAHAFSSSKPASADTPPPVVASANPAPTAPTPPAPAGSNAAGSNAAADVANAAAAAPSATGSATAGSAAPTPTGPTAAARPAPQPPHPAPPTDPSKPAEVMLKITTTPSDATVLLDGQRLGHTPYEASVPRADGTHKLKIRRRGYTTTSIDVDLTANVDKTVTLQPVPPQPPADE